MNMKPVWRFQSLARKVHNVDQLMQIEIKHRLTDKTLWNGEAVSLKEAVEKAIAAKADLRGANLQGADLREVDLQGATLRWSDLRGSDLRGADIRECDIRGSVLQGADFYGADSRGAKGISPLLCPLLSMPKDSDNAD